MADGPTSLDDFTPEQLKALQDIAQARVDDSLSRRDALKALGMVGAGAAVGAGGRTALTEPAKADASTTDSDGDVGAPNDRVDGFFDGVDATSVSADEVFSDKGAADQRLHALYEANKIRANAGIPDAEVVGPRYTPGLSDSSSLTSSSAISITTESEASNAADSGSGSESDPYVIQDREITGESSQGFKWNDSDADYYIKLVNCEIHNNQPAKNYDGEVFVNTPTKLTLENCYIHSEVENNKQIRFPANGKLEIVKSLISGGNRWISSTPGGPDELIVTDSRFDESDAGVNNVSTMELFNMDLTFRYSTFKSDTVSTLIRPYDEGPFAVDVTNCEFITNSGRGFALDKNAYTNGAEIAEGSSWKYSHFECDGDALNFVGQNRGDYEVSYCDLRSTTGRAFFVDRNEDTGNGISEGWDVHHCKGWTDPETGAETFEGWRVRDTSFRYCWSEACGDDAFEYAFPITNCNVENCVGDNTTGEIVDYYQVGPRVDDVDGEYKISSDVHHIYGDCGNSAVTIGGGDYVLVHSIFAEAGENGVELISGGTSHDADYCQVYGPLPLSENVSENVLSVADVQNNIAVWLENNQIQTIGDPEATRTTVR